MPNTGEAEPPTLHPPKELNVKRLTITAVDIVNGDVVIRTVTETKRFYHRRVHYVGRVYVGDYGDWRAQRTGKIPSKAIWKQLDAAYLRAVEANAEAAAGVIRQVSRPSV